MIDPLERDHGPLVSLKFFIIMALLPFFAEFRDGSYSLNTKTLFHGTPTMHLWTPCYAWTTDADPHRDDRAASEGPVDPQSSVFLRTGPVFLAFVPAATEGQKNLVLTKTVSI